MLYCLFNKRKTACSDNAGGGAAAATGVPGQPFITNNDENKDKRMKHAAQMTAALLVLAGALGCPAAPTYVTNVTAQQRFGTNLVDITYNLLDPSGGLFNVQVRASTNAGASYVPLLAVSGDVGSGMTTGVNKQVVWSVPGDLPGVNLFTGRVQVIAYGYGGYLIINISGGPFAASYPVIYTNAPPPLDFTHKTSRIVLRRIPAGWFMMGSPQGELGREIDEVQRVVTFTNSCYVGIFEVTQAQYTNVMGGSNPAGYMGVTRPVEYLSWDTVRGGTWPGGAPDTNSFFGKLRSKTGLNFDLPTEARWEYVCRAGSKTAWNNGTQITNFNSDGNLDLLGRYSHNGGFGHAHASVGSYQTNWWELYDMHGNVWEWCLDWYGTYGGDATDPAGPVSGTYRVSRGGSYADHAANCRAADRGLNPPYDANYFTGFRVFLPAAP